MDRKNKQKKKIKRKKNKHKYQTARESDKRSEQAKLKGNKEINTHHQAEINTVQPSHIFRLSPTTGRGKTSSPLAEGSVMMTAGENDVTKR